MIPPPPFSTRCCDQKGEVTTEMICQLLPEILKQYRYLWDRHKQMTNLKRKRTLQLAEPVVKRAKYSFQCPCRDGERRKVQIMRIEERPCTRTEQLAYPQVSQLLELKRHSSYPSFEPLRKQSVNQMMHRSLNSLYSRLSNTGPPQPPKQAAKWSQEEWVVHRSYMRLLARPKKVPEPEEPTAEQHTRVLHGLKRTHRLAKPKEYVELSQNEWRFTDSLKNYVPSQRILRLAKQTKPRPTIFDAFQVKPEALKYRASPRIVELAIAPARMFKKKAQITAPTFHTSPNALKYKTSRRIKELSEPREHSNDNIKANPYKVKRSALNFRITKRLRELAKPRTYPK